MWNVDGLAALVEQVSVEDTLPLNIRLDSLVHHHNDRVGGSRTQTRLHVHANVLDILQTKFREVDPVRRNLLRQENVSYLVEAALIIDGIARPVEDGGVDVYEGRDRVFVDRFTHHHQTFGRVDRIH